jgi:hypothetical protein
MSSNEDTEPAEDAVRAYLTFLDDPSKLVDAAAVQELKATADNAKDPIERLLAIAALKRATATDGNAYKYEFIKRAREWAQAQGVPASAFRSLGVPDDVIVAAGLDGARRRGRDRTARGTASASASASTTRRPAVKAERVEQGIATLSGPFTVKDVVDRVGGSPQGVLNVISRLETEGKVWPAGSRSSGRGPAARTWRLVTTI